MPWRCREMLPEHQLVHEDLFFFMLNSSLRRLLQRDLPSSDVTERPVVFPTRTSTFKSLDFAAYRFASLSIVKASVSDCVGVPTKVPGECTEWKKKKVPFSAKSTGSDTSSSAFALWGRWQTDDEPVIKEHFGGVESLTRVLSGGHAAVTQVDS